MSTDRAARISKRLSYWLRHRPEEAGLTLDAAGWASTEEVLAALAGAGLPHRLEELAALVGASDKQRFELSDDSLHIRARQGHSIPVQLDWPVTTPPAVLFHGTVRRFLEPILAEGLRPMRRHHVHLSPDRETAMAVGARRGDPLILEIASGRMAEAGHLFRLTANKVWLSDHVPPEYLKPM